MSAARSINDTIQHGGSAPWADPGWSGAMAFTGPVHLHDGFESAPPQWRAHRLRSLLSRRFARGGGPHGRADS
ncbi:hypothetical protein [Agromyces sp. GXS1127]|uniref:hypothetical protein n=1 Tax=Agromyces sp. GXS1127 TaxID=3424181 RepID=UPI003D31E202